MTPFLTFAAGPSRREELRLEEVPLHRIAESVGTPAYVYSSRALLEPLQELQRLLAPANPLICFAVKSCSNLNVLRLLASHGAGMDLVSGGELKRALEAGTPAQRLVLSGVGKTKEEMRLALEKGIYAFNVESIEELEVLQEAAAGAGKDARISLRFNPDVDAKTHPHIATGLHRNKFGLSRKEILAAIARLKALPRLRLAGLGVHIGSQITSLSPLDEAFTGLRKLMDELSRKERIAWEFVDVGGGLGIRYSKEKPPALDRYAKLVLSHFGPASGLSAPLRVITEPGRLISGPAGVLLTQVLYRKDHGKRRFLICDAAMNDLIRPALYDGHHEIVPLQKIKGAKFERVDVVGPVCESADFLARDRQLPRTLAKGDLLAVLNAGAYGFAMASNYNSRGRPPEVLVRGHEFSLIRRRETYDDLVAAERPL